MIEIKLNEHQDAYDIVGEYIEKYWQEHYYTDVIVRVAASYDGKTYAPSNEFVAFDGHYGMEYQNDWWEGERYLRIYGIIDIHEVNVPDTIFDPLEKDDESQITEHIMMIEFTKTISNFELPMVAIYNDRYISESEVNDIIKNGRADYTDDIVVMTKKQYENLCAKQRRVSDAN